MRKVGTCALAGVVVILLTGIEARALINPNFTPIQLVEQSTEILVLKCGKPDEKARVVCQVHEALKGKAAQSSVTIDLSAWPEPDTVKAAAALVAASGDQPALLFAGEYHEEGGAGEQLASAYLHVSGKWLGLFRAEHGTWELASRIDANQMEATWAGGSDMLLRCVKYIQTAPDPDVPVAAGTSWDRQEKIAHIAGQVSSVQAVDLVGDGRLSLYAASDAGDRLFAFQPEKKAFEDLTAARGLKARSKVAVWGDFNGDGRVDLASWDGSALSIWQQAADGTFASQPIKVGDALKSGCLGLAVVDVGQKGRPGLLASTPGAPVLLAPGSDGGLQPKPFPKKNPLPADLGKPAPAVVADLDGDGLADVLQPFERASLLYRGTGAGVFAEPLRSPVALGNLPGKAWVGDFDHDGLLDVFVVAADQRCGLYHNLGGGKFLDYLFISGEIAYISQPDARGAQVCDVNNDGRQDVLIWYSNLRPLIFFNRGFRSFGHAHTLDLQEQGLLDEKTVNGQQAALVADLNGDGAQDMVVVPLNGDVWVFFRAIYLEAGLAVRAVLPPGGDFAGPLTVTGFVEKRCLGAWNVVAGSAEAFLARIDAGPLELRWQFPGGKPQKKEVILESAPVRLILKPEK